MDPRGNPHEGSHTSAMGVPSMRDAMVVGWRLHGLFPFTKRIFNTGMEAGRGSYVSCMGAVNDSRLGGGQTFHGKRRGLQHFGRLHQVLPPHTTCSICRRGIVKI